MDWSRIDTSEWQALLVKQNRLPDINTATLEQLNLEALTGKDSRLDFDQQREDSRKRLEARYKGISTLDVDQFLEQKTGSFRIWKEDSRN